MSIDDLFITNKKIHNLILLYLKHSKLVLLSLRTPIVND